MLIIIKPWELQIFGLIVKFLIAGARLWDLPDLPSIWIVQSKK